MSLDFNDEQQINTIVDEYINTGSEVLKLELLKKFDPYFNKYSYMLCSSRHIDVKNKDTITFLRLFMTKEERDSEDSIFFAAKKVIIYLRGLFKDSTPADVHDDMVCIFLEQLKRYHPMIANKTKHKNRISFTHFMQVNMRYKLCNLIKLRAKDALYCSRNVEFNDEMNDSYVDARPGVNYNIIDLKWVHGATTGEIFSQLEEYERYLLYLKYETNCKPLSDYDLAKLTGQDRMYIRRKMLSIKTKLKSLAEVQQ